MDASNKLASIKERGGVGGATPPSGGHEKLLLGGNKNVLALGTLWAERFRQNREQMQGLGLWARDQTEGSSMAWNKQEPRKMESGREAGLLHWGKVEFYSGTVGSHWRILGMKAK